MNMAFHAGRRAGTSSCGALLETIPLSARALRRPLHPHRARDAAHLLLGAPGASLDGELRAPRRTTGAVPERAVLPRCAASIYFALWIVVARLLHGWSARQDEEGGVALTVKQRRLGAGALPFLAVAMTFAAFDWQMSLDLHLASTIFGALLVRRLVPVGLRGAHPRGQRPRAEDGLAGGAGERDHYHYLGKYLLAFTAFWAYIAFSQFLLIWIANLPEEVPWYIARGQGGWRAAGRRSSSCSTSWCRSSSCSRAPLKRSPRALGLMAVWVLVVHYVDLYWVDDAGAPARPARRARACTGPTSRRWWASGGATPPSWPGASAAAPPCPLKDPYLEESLRYDPS